MASEYNTRKKKARHKRKVVARRVFDKLVQVIFALSMFCVILGVAALALGITDNMIAIFTGAILAIGLVIISMFRPLPDPEKKRRRKIDR